MENIIARIATCDILPSDARLAGWYVSADGQGMCDMTGLTLADALAELLDQCGSSEEEAATLAGTIDILEAQVEVSS